MRTLEFMYSGYPPRSLVIRDHVIHPERMKCFHRYVMNPSSPKLTSCTDNIIFMLKSSKSM